jgi:hypothetical protein
MRELNTREISAVSGGNFETIGSVAGGLADQVSAILGLTTNYKDSAVKIGTGINQVLQLNISGAITNISGGVLGLANTFFSAVGSLFSSKS